jgi:processive 1,2-diacylglycerol beta-glucosyltransferase
MKRILILTARFGEGHNAAARNLSEALRALCPDEVRVEVRDLFEGCYGRWNDLVRCLYLETIRRAPGLWAKFYCAVDSSTAIQSKLGAFPRVKRALAEVLRTVRPDVVVSTFPSYGHLLDSIRITDQIPQFSLVTIITDSISINSIWYRCSSRYFIVANEATAGVLKAGGVDEECIRVLGFPVPIKFSKLDPNLRPSPEAGVKILFMVNAHKRQAVELSQRLAALDGVELTVTTGLDDRLQRVIQESTSSAGNCVQVLGWTERMPELMASSHLLVGKAGGATVQEAIAARCPMLITHVIPGQEEGNARLLVESGCGEVVGSVDHAIGVVERLFANGADEWKRWYSRISELNNPGAPFDIARFVLEVS